LSVALAVSQDQRPKVKTENKPAARRRVLIVDDNLDTAQSLFLLLLDMGHDAAFALNGSQALERARTLRPEFVFLDIGLPDLDGSDVARRLKSIPGCEQALIVAITGLGDEHRARMLQAGCEAFYVKPLDPKVVQSFLMR
jgi:CheY-like chemotaxis protein